MRTLFFLLCAGLFFAGCNKTSKNLRFYSDIEPTKVKIETSAKAAEKEVVKVKEETVIPDPTLNITIYFAFDSDGLTPQAIDDIEQAAYKLAQCKKPLGAIGHACPIGFEDYNYDLGLRRANRVYDYIKELVPCQVLPSSVGESNLVTTDQEKYNLNRIVTLKTLN